MRLKQLAHPTSLSGLSHDKMPKKIKEGTAIIICLKILSIQKSMPLLFA